MPRPRKIDPIRMAVQDLGRILGRELGATVGTAVSRVAAVAAKPVGKRGRPAFLATEAPCAVPSCGKKRVSWGLCSSHYQKARRLEMKRGKLDLATLAEDRRIMRWVS
ncbi:MAG: hypothetical protein JST54_12130 [Deltaproteobacteria bacterium]|nr:hypothetical protein [Deltaproteobacteria bacterium]